MIQATSGQDFRKKVIDEFVELNDRQRFIYAAVCLVHSQRHTLTRGEIQLALGSADNEALNDIETLVRRHLVTRETVQTEYRSRHRVIAEQVVDAMQERLIAAPVLEGLCFAFAQDVDQATPFTSRSRQRLIRFINHDFVLRMVKDIDAARRIYGTVEQLLKWDYHYWLHRGSAEVETGDLNLAEHFLGQASSMMPDDPYVRTEYGYLLMKKGAQHANHPEARDWVEKGMEILADQIEYDPTHRPHPYHNWQSRVELVAESAN